MRLALLSFENYLLANRNTEKPVLHIALSPAPEDKLDDEQLAELAQMYMQKMGYGNQPIPLPTNTVIRTIRIFTL